MMVGKYDWSRCLERLDHEAGCDEIGLAKDLVLTPEVNVSINSDDLE